MRSGKCKTDLNNFDVEPGFPGPFMPGFGLNISIPGLDIPFPEGFPENIFDLLNKLRLKFPLGMDLSGIADEFMRKLSQIISNILTQMSVFLALYNIIMVIIQMIVCIIEVLCGLIKNGPKKLKRLFKTCLPLFISIFPFLALLALILAILALILAIIEYIIAILKKILDELKRNYNNLKIALKREQNPGKSAAILAITRKIASILCVLENIMLLFMVIIAVIKIIEQMLKMNISFPCDNSKTDPDCPCCSDCAELIMYPQTISDQNAKLYYAVNFQMISGLPATETITMTADDLVTLKNGQYTFSNLLQTNFNGCTYGPFFPSAPLSSNYRGNMAPYLIDLDMAYSTGVGARIITVKDIVIQWVEDSTNPKGVLTLIGGKVQDPLQELNDKSLLYLFNNGTTPITPNPIEPDPEIEEKNCTINEFKPNYDVLGTSGLTSFDCNPDFLITKTAFYNSLGDTTAFADFEFPNVQKVMDDYTNAISKFREKINDDTIDEFINNMNNIMEDLKKQTENSYSNALQFMVNPLYSFATLDPEIQFVSDKIVVKITLRNASKQTFKDVIGDFVVPEKAINDLISKLKAEVSLGKTTKFIYDQSSGVFITEIISNVGGDGILKLFYDNQQFGQLIIPINDDENSRIEELEFEYSFVGGEMDTDGGIRRDETDVG